MLLLGGKKLLIYEMKIITVKINLEMRMYYKNILYLFYYSLKIIFLFVI